MRSITPFLWFDDDLEQAVEYYTSVIPDSTVHSMVRQPDGKVAMAEFEIAGQRVKGLNGGPIFPHTEAFSFFVECDDQAEVDRYWDTLTSEGGEEGQCGWLKDRFGLSWQVVPTALIDMLQDKDAQKAQRVMQAMLQMTKLDIARLNAAYAG